MSNWIWGLGVRARSFAKRAKLLGRLESVLLKAGPRLIPPPTEEVKVLLPWGMRMTVPAGLPSARSYATSLYEVEVTNVFRQLVRRGTIVVDAGANVGYYSLLAAHLVGPDGKVYAFEPDPKNHAYLQKNLAQSGCTMVEAIRKAISDRTGQGAFVQDRFGVEGHLLVTNSESPLFAVETVSLDDFFSERKWPRVDVIKMDIEGAEQRALEGMKELARRNPSLRLVMEISKRHMREAGVTEDALAATLRDVGFRAGLLIEEELRPFDLQGGLPKTRTIEYDLLLAKEPHPWAPVTDSQLRA